MSQNSLLKIQLRSLLGRLAKETKTPQAFRSSVLELMDEFVIGMSHELKRREHTVETDVDPRSDAEAFERSLR